MKHGITLLIATLVLGCGTARRGEPFVAAPEPAPPGEVQRGHAAYDRFCNGCHPGGEAGVGPAINNKPVPSAAIRLQVRTGVGAMPAFDEEVISDVELDEILAYLDWIEERKPMNLK